MQDSRLACSAWTMSANKTTSTIRDTNQIAKKAATCCTAGQKRKSPKTFVKLSKPTNSPALVNARYRA